MKKYKSVVAAVAALSMMVASLPAEARAGSTSGSRSSASSASRTTPAAKPSPSLSATSQRAGSGGSIGMSRPDVVNQARAKSPGADSRYYGSVGSGQPGRQYDTGPAYGNRYSQPAPPAYGGYTTPQPRTGYSGGQVAGAAIAGALAGGLVGHALSNSNTPTQPAAPAPTAQAAAPAPMPGAAPGYQPQYRESAGDAPLGSPTSLSNAATAPAPATAAALQSTTSSAESGFGFLGLLMLLVGMGVVGFLAFRRLSGTSTTARQGHLNTSVNKSTSPMFGNSTAASSSDSQETKDLAIARELLSQAPKFFRDLQSANNRGDKEALAGMTDNAELLKYMVDDIDNRSEPSATHVLNVEVVRNEVSSFMRDGANYIGSIHYAATISEGTGVPEDIEEVWHFIRSTKGGTWKLAGIEQV